MKKITDSEGHSIQMMSLSEAIFDDHGEQYLIGIEGLTENGVAIYTNDITPKSNPVRGLITQERRNEIVTATIRLFESDGLRVEVY